jgi:hypothetical protein
VAAAGAHLLGKGVRDQVARLKNAFLILSIDSNASVRNLYPNVGCCSAHLYSLEIDVNRCKGPAKLNSILGQIDDYLHKP